MYVAFVVTTHNEKYLMKKERTEVRCTRQEWSMIAWGPPEIATRCFVCTDLLLTYYMRLWYVTMGYEQHATCVLRRL